jgi:uncharacterized protein (DUF58 family)
MAIEDLVRTETLRLFDKLTFVSRVPARAGAGGEHRARRPAPSTDFVDYRPYAPGDDFRRVDWNVYARLGSLQLKVTEGRERLDVFLVLDCSSSMDTGQPDKLEFAAQLVAALAYVGMARADQVRISCLSQPDQPRLFGPFGRRARLPRLLQLLSGIAPAGPIDLDASLAACVTDATGSRPPLVVVVSDLLTPGGVVSGLQALQLQRTDVAVIHVVSPDESDPRISGEVELLDAESGEVLELGVSMETLAAYRARFAAWLEERASACRARGIRYTRVRTDRPLASVVLDDLRRGGLLH